MENQAQRHTSKAGKRGKDWGLYRQARGWPVLSIAIQLRPRNEQAAATTARRWRTSWFRSSGRSLRESEWSIPWGCSLGSCVRHRKLSTGRSERKAGRWPGLGWMSL